MIKWFFPLLILHLPVHGQGILIDQQSTNLVEGAAFLGDSNEQIGQSFTPTLSSIGFIALNLYDADVLHSLGTTVLVNVRANSISGPILSSTTPVSMPNDFFGVTHFVFPTAVPVTPGVTYYFQPVIQSGDNWGAYVTDGSYAGGSEIFQGIPGPGRNLWFQEGVVVPEPSVGSLIFIGSGIFFCIRRISKK